MCHLTPKRKTFGTQRDQRQWIVCYRKRNVHVGFCEICKTFHLFDVKGPTGYVENKKKGTYTFYEMKNFIIVIWQTQWPHIGFKLMPFYLGKNSKAYHADRTSGQANKFRYVLWFVCKVMESENKQLAHYFPNKWRQG